MLADHLAPGDHEVELYRDTESHQGVTRLQGFTEGVVGQAPPSSGRLVEIVGDSISAAQHRLFAEVLARRLRERLGW